jgi:hypothetical protein
VLTAGGGSFDAQKGESGAQFRKTFLPELVPEPHSLLDLLFGNPRRFNPGPPKSKINSHPRYKLLRNAIPGLNSPSASTIPARITPSGICRWLPNGINGPPIKDFPRQNTHLRFAWAMARASTKTFLKWSGTSNPPPTMAI